MEPELIRTYYPEGTNGKIFSQDRLMMYSIELPWCYVIAWLMARKGLAETNLVLILSHKVDLPPLFDLQKPYELSDSLLLTIRKNFRH